eukprot:EG_transcript_8999
MWWLPAVGLLPLLVGSVLVLICQVKLIVARFQQARPPVRTFVAEAHAVVIGGSIAGLIAAKMLARHFGTVTIVERDDGGDDPEAPALPPQAHHSHLILRKALDVMGEYFPGLEAAALLKGARPLTLQQLHIVVDGVRWAQSAGQGITFLGCPRSTIQRVLHEDILQDGRIVLHRGATVVDVLCDAAEGQPGVVSGVKVRRKGSDAVAEMRASLVVDCSGRHSNAAKWVERCGGRVVTEEWPSQVCYASVTGTLRRPPPWDLLYLPPHPPHRPHGVCVLAVTEGTPASVLVSAITTDSSGVVPRDHDGFRRFVLAAVAEADEETRAVLAQLQFEAADIREYRQPCSVRRFFPSLPLGFIPVGDSVASFNPIFGQGVATACVAVESLDVALACNPADPQALQRQYFAMLLPFVGRVWDLVALHDPGPAPSPRPASLAAALVALYLRGVGRAMHLPWVADRWYPFVHLCAAPWAVLHPSLVCAALLGFFGFVSGAKPSPKCKTS